MKIKIRWIKKRLRKINSVPKQGTTTTFPNFPDKNLKSLWFNSWSFHNFCFPLSSLSLLSQQANLHSSFCLSSHHFRVILISSYVCVCACQPKNVMSTFRLTAQFHLNNLSAALGRSWLFSPWVKFQELILGFPSKMIFIFLNNFFSFLSLSFDGWMISEKKSFVLKGEEIS